MEAVLATYGKNPLLVPAPTWPPEASYLSDAIWTWDHRATQAEAVLTALKEEKQVPRKATG
jgi:hypothetical protein